MLTMSEMGSSAGMLVPRTCGRQTTRSNVEASTPEEYWRRTIFIPFLDHLIQEFEGRFTQLSEQAVRGLQLLPSTVSKLGAEDTQAICQRFKEDLPSPETFSQEVRRWQSLWSSQPMDPPSTLSDTVLSSLFSPKTYLQLYYTFCLLHQLQHHLQSEQIPL